MEPSKFVHLEMWHPQNHLTVSPIGEARRGILVSACCRNRLFHVRFEVSDFWYSVVQYMSSVFFAVDHICDDGSPMTHFFWAGLKAPGCDLFQEENDDGLHLFQTHRP